MNFKQLIEHRAAQTPDRLGYRFLPSDRDEMCLTYGQLARRASSLADELRRLVPAGQRALLLYPAGFDFICAFFACLLADVVAVPLPVPQADNGTERLEHVIRDCSPAIILTHSGILTRIQALLPPPLQQTVVATDVQPDWRHAAVSPDKADASLALLQYTSGSTGRPKGVCVSHENLHANLQQIEQAFGHSSDSQGVIWLPHYHDMGLIGGVLQPLFVGFPVTLFSPIAFVQRPVRWLQAIHTYRATTSGGPNFAYDLCVHKAASLADQDLDLSCWTVAFNGAEPVKATTLDAFVSAFSPAGFRRSAFLPCYGLAEATLLVTASERNSEPVLATSPHMATSANIEFTVDGGKPLVSCGVAAAGVSVHIAPVDGSGHSAPGEIGEIVVQGPNVSLGYWDAVRTPPSGPHVSPLRTGDLGFLLDSRLYVTGRLTDLIILRGRNIFPEDLEATAERAEPRLAREGCAAFCVQTPGAHEVVLIQEVSLRTLRTVDINQVSQRVSLRILEQHGIRIDRFLPVKIGSLARTSSGKVSRSATKQLYLDNKLHALPTPADH